MKFNLPSVGSKVKYEGPALFWFADLIDNAKKNLSIGKRYTIKTIKVLPSWCSITLEETDDSIEYPLNFFTWI